MPAFWQVSKKHTWKKTPWMYTFSLFFTLLKHSLYLSYNAFLFHSCFHHQLHVLFACLFAWFFTGMQSVARLAVCVSRYLTATGIQHAPRRHLLTAGRASIHCSHQPSISHCRNTCKMEGKMAKGRDACPEDAPGSAVTDGKVWFLLELL